MYKFAGLRIVMTNNASLNIRRCIYTVSNTVIENNCTNYIQELVYIILCNGCEIMQPALFAHLHQMLKWLAASFLSSKDLRFPSLKWMQCSFMAKYPHFCYCVCSQFMLPPYTHGKVFDSVTAALQQMKYCAVSRPTSLVVTMHGAV